MNAMLFYYPQVIPQPKAQVLRNVLACCKLLLEAGADPHVMDDAGVSVMEMVVAHTLRDKKKMDLLELLLQFAEPKGGVLAQVGGG